ncbi:MAG: DUF177 domain-containing protein [Pseudomonadota bacterium]
MIVRLRSIPQEGMDLSFVIPPDQVRNGFPEDDETREYFAQEVSCQVHLDLNRKDVFLTGNAGTSMHPVCARCGEAYESTLSVELELTCSPAAKVPHGADVIQESDEGVIFYRKDALDLSEIVREQLLLSLPIRYLCDPDCKGLCLHCGANLNEGQHDCKKHAPVN